MKFKISRKPPAQKQAPIVQVVDKIVHVDKHVYVDREIIKYVDREVFVDRQVPVDREVIKEVQVEKIVKEVVFVDKPFPVEKIKEVFVDRPVEVIVEKLMFKTHNFVWVALALETVLLVIKLIK